MDYHIPAPQWAIFGLPDFESYKQQLVVKGLFHSDVPKDVIAAYEVAEYMMAHAYYHYPLYDEALSKLLRIIEMAVKIRCRQVDIPLITTTINKKTKKEIHTDKKFKNLIDELSEAIAIKDIVDQLHRLREARNSRMHQSSHTYSGAMFFQVIKSSVIILNKLFLQQILSDNNNQRLLYFKKAIIQFQKGCFVLERNSKKYLVVGLQIVDSVFIKSEWFQLLVFFQSQINLANK